MTSELRAKRLVNSDEEAGQDDQDVSRDAKGQARASLKRVSWTILFVEVTVLALALGFVSMRSGTFASIKTQTDQRRIARRTSAETEDSPIDKLTLLKQEIEQAIEAPPLVASSPEAFESATQWLYSESFDKTGGTHGRSLLGSRFERFVLAWFWFHTTKGGDKPWISCNRPNTEIGETAECEFLTPAVVELVDDDPVICYSTIPAMRWLSTANECEWAGISCNENGQVVAIELLGVGLSGTFPAFLSLLRNIEDITLTYGALSGNLPSRMSRFPNLHQLTLIGNLLKGPLPSGLFSLPLWVLNLGYNKFKGIFPEGFGKLEEIAALYLMNNSFEGPLPNNLSEAQSLIYLQLQNNALTGTTLPPYWGIW